MGNRKYSTDHEWIEIDGNIATVGITEHAQEQLGDIVFVELPEIGSKFAKDAQVAIVESVKAASDIYAPISGEVIEANTAVVDDNGLINSSPEEAAWLFKLRIQDASELDSLMDAAAYKKLIE